MSKTPPGEEELDRMWEQLRDAYAENRKLRQIIRDLVRKARRGPPLSRYELHKKLVALGAATPGLARRKSSASGRPRDEKQRARAEKIQSLKDRSGVSDAAAILEYRRLEGRRAAGAEKDPARHFLKTLRRERK